MNDGVTVSQAGQPRTLEVHESAKAAGCYSFVGERFFINESLNPAWVAEIRANIPRFVPLVCRRVYRAPTGGEESHDYHVIGMYIPTPTEEYEADYVPIDHAPPRFPFDKNKIQALRTLWAQWPKESVEYDIAAPPARVEFGPWVIEQMRALRKAMDGMITLESEEGRLKSKQKSTTRDFLNEILQAEGRRDELIQKQAMDEARYRMRHNWRQFKEAADKGRLVPEPPDDASKKSFLDLKG